MMGYNHVSCGLVASLATLPVAPVTGPAAQAAWVIALGGASLLPDLDTTGSTAARMWGPPTRILAAGVGAVARGHRQGTHDLVLAPIVAGLAVLAAALHSVTLGMVLALTTGLALRGLTLAGAGRVGAATNLAISIVTAWWLITHGAQNLRALALVVAGGVLVHILGDLPTREGVPFPIAWLFGVRRRISLDLFRVNSPLERFIVAPALSLLGIWLLCAHLGIHDVDSLMGWTDGVVGLAPGSPDRLGVEPSCLVAATPRPAGQDRLSPGSSRSVTPTVPTATHLSHPLARRARAAPPLLNSEPVIQGGVALVSPSSGDQPPASRSLTASVSPSITVTLL